MEKQHRQGDPGVGPSRPRVQIQAGSLLFLGDVRSSLREGEADTDTAPVYAVLLGRDPRDARRWVAVPADDVPIEPDGDLFLAPTADPAEVAGLWVRMPLAFTIADEEVRRLEVCGRVGSAHVLEIADVLTGADDDGVEDLAGIDEVDAAFDRRERLLVAIADMLPDAGPEADLSTELRSIRRDEGTVVVAVEPGAPASELRLAAAGPRDPVDRDRWL
jgi:hypothetical protein